MADVVRNTSQLVAMPTAPRSAEYIMSLPPLEAYKKPWRAPSHRPRSVHHRRLEDAHHGGAAGLVADGSGPCAAVAAVAQRLAGLRALDDAADLDLELASSTDRHSTEPR